MINNQDPKPFDHVHLQWFAEDTVGGGTEETTDGGETTETTEIKPPEKPPAKPVEQEIPKFLSYAADKHKKDPKVVADLSKHKSWSEIVDRMYAAEGKLAEQPQVPDALEGYEFAEAVFPEELKGDERKQYREELQAYIKQETESDRKFAFENKLSPEIAKKINERFVQRLLAQEKAAREFEEKAKKDGIEALKADWKADLEPNSEIARRAIQTFGGDEIVKRLEAKGFANDPDVIKIFYTIGKGMGEDTLVPGTGKPADLSPEEQKQANLKDRYKNSPEMFGERSETPTAVIPENLKGRYKSMETPE